MARRHVTGVTLSARRKNVLSMLAGPPPALSYGPEDLLNEGITVLKPEDRWSAADTGRNQPLENELQKNPGAVLNVVSEISQYAVEPLDYFRSGHYRATIVFSATAIESALRRRYPKDKSFFDMITHAKRDGLLDSESIREISTIRLARNSLVHELNNGVTLVEAECVLRAAFIILDKLASNKA